VPVRLASSNTASCLAIPACSASSTVSRPAGWHARHRLSEDLADHHWQLGGLLVIAWPKLGCGAPTAALAADRRAPS